MKGEKKEMEEKEMGKENEKWGKEDIGRKKEDIGRKKEDMDRKDREKKKKIDLLTLFDLDRDTMLQLIDRTFHIYLGDRGYEGKLSGSVGLIFFEKPSTRTRISFESAIIRMGGGVIYSNPSETQLSRGEEIMDFARTVSGYVDFVVARVYKHSVVEELAKFGSIPVINALSDLSHPTQIIADLASIKHFLGDFQGKKIVFVGDAKNNVARSWIEAHTILGNFCLTFSCPEGFEPDLKGDYKIERDLKIAVKDANIIYTDVWFSMGENFSEEKKRKLIPYRIDETLPISGIVMHCLPAHKGEEISQGVFEKFQKYIFTQAHMKLSCAISVLELIAS